MARGVPPVSRSGASGPGSAIARLVPRAPVVLALVVSVTAFAGTYNATNAEWAVPPNTANNIEVGGGNLNLTTNTVLVDDFYRRAYDGTIFEATAEKDNGNFFSAADRCLLDADNPGLAGPMIAVNGHDTRIGTHVERLPPNDYVASIPSDTLIPIPSKGTTFLPYLEAVRFVTSGSRVVATSYDVVFHYASVPDETVTVPIARDNEANRDATTADYEIVGLGSLLVNNTSVTWDQVNPPAGTDCAGAEGDEVTVFNPLPDEIVESIEFVYPEATDTPITAWLGGPLSLTLLTDDRMDQVWDYTGTWSASAAVASAPRHNPVRNVFWNQMTWTAGGFGTASNIIVTFQCGDDDDSDGTLETGELSAPITIGLRGRTSPYAFTTGEVCEGRYIQYSVDIVDALSDSPHLDSITFNGVDDVDGDHFPASAVGGVAADCDDALAAVNPGATESPGDGVDSNCNGVENCYVDQDDDGTRSAATQTGGANGDADCNDQFEGLQGDLVAGATDCDDTTSTIEPGIPEVAGNNVDNNCNGVEDCYFDADDDGTRSASVQTGGANGDGDCNDQFEGLFADTVSGTVDCDDTTSTIEPGILEVVGNNVDNNCDNVEDCYVDSDDDGIRSNATQTGGVNGDGDCNDNREALLTDVGAGNVVDCVDTDGAIKPGIAETAGNGADNNCDGVEDCYVDADDDGTRSATTRTGGANNDADCSDATEGLVGDLVSGATDCVDTDPAIEPGITETAGNGVDNNCDGVEDCYVDQDDDGTRVAGTQAGGQNNDGDCNDAREGLFGDTVGGVLDCDDTTTTIEPGIPEVVANNIDNNCDGVEDCYIDQDDDGTRSATPQVGGQNGDADCNDLREALATDLHNGTQVDCNDNDAAVEPGITEVAGNNVDNNCDNVEDCYIDSDDDGTRVAGTQTGGQNSDPDCNDPREALFADTFGGAIDCDDTTSTIEPGIAEVAGNNIDNNCDNVEDCYVDDDDDGTRSNNILTGGRNGDADCNENREALATDLHNGTQVDCDDTTAAVEPGIPEVIGNNVDNNCDTVENCYLDQDDDGTRSATQQIGGQNNDADCNDLREALTTDLFNGTQLDCVDTDAAIEPGIFEVVGNDVDNNCDGIEDCYADQDDDGTRGTAVVTGGTNNDADCGDVREGRAGDLHNGTTADCVDTDAAIEPGIPEVTGNNVDNNCDAIENCFVDADGDNVRPNDNTDTGGVNNDADCNDPGEAVLGDLINGEYDCDDGARTTYPTAPDGCGDGVDDNCDGLSNSTFVGATVDDDDGDGLTFDEEEGYGTDDCDLDTDDEGLTDPEEISLGTDPLDPDSDADGMEDDVEVRDVLNPANTDNDGLIDPLDQDDDGDGLLSALEDVNGDGNPRNDDADGDTVRNPLDTDDDNDGVLTRNEDTNADGNWGDDQDSDGRPNWRDDDDDGDGIRTVDELPTTVNTDGTSPNNWLDADDDDDTVPTRLENVDGAGDARDDDTDGDTVPNYEDTDDDGDGILTRNEYADAPNRDVDGDLDENHVDQDSDGDGYPDSVEGRVDTDRDGKYDYLDTDSDGDTVPDAEEVDQDYDSDGADDRLDTDDDGDGITSAREYADGRLDDDPDGDGDPSWLDLDSDGDDWTDAHEGTPDEDGDGTPSYLDDDSDADDLPDRLENRTVDPDTDGDGLENRIDPDDDDDCVATRRELGPPNNPSDQDLDRTADYLDDDDDDDTLMSCDENPCNDADPYSCDSDGDGLADHLDDDDDDDGILTVDELGFEDADRSGTGAADIDDIPNHLDDDSDGDGFPDTEEDPAGALVTSDNDPTPDFVDYDSDNDKVLDSAERHSDTDSDGDDDRIDDDDDGDSLRTDFECFPACDNDPRNDNNDGDTFPNYLDTDDDGDGILTRDDDFDHDGSATTGDTDVDGTPDWVDTDDDGDTVFTIDEEREDRDGDGFPNHRDADDDNDGFPTAEEVDLDLGTSPLDFDFDFDGLENYRDDDDDDDHAGTLCEETWTAGALEAHLSPDSDFDGFLDGDEWPAVWGEDVASDCAFNSPAPADTDGDGTYDPLDADDDADGIETSLEVGFAQGIDADCAWTDLNEDGVIDLDDGEVDPAFRVGDGVPDHRDRDSDGDGLEDGLADSIAVDSDSDGTFDKNDCDNSGCDGDTDGDGLTNREETEVCCRIGLDFAGDPDGDADCVVSEDTCGCVLTERRDSDFDGVRDFLDVGQVTQPRDTDGDGIFDVLDEDDDGDGLPTLEENFWFLQLDCDGEQWDLGMAYADDAESGEPTDRLLLECEEFVPRPDPERQAFGYQCDDAPDDEWVFFCDASERSFSNVDASSAGGDANPNPYDAPTRLRDDFNPPARESDGDPNFLDPDDDGDGVSTADELALPDPDVDGDGWVNWYDRADEDGPIADPDGDGLTNQREGENGFDAFSDDTDGDGVPDALEFGDQARPQDSDGDGVFDGLDLDDDGDGIATSLEGEKDSDGDGAPDFLDADSDNDGQSDGAEVGVDGDCDGLDDRVDGVDDGLCDPATSTLTHARQGCACAAAPTGTPSGFSVGLVLGAAALARRRRIVPGSGRPIA